MKTSSHSTPVTRALAALWLTVAASFGQGSLTPPGPPVPTMKTLAQIEPRTPISSLPYTISNGGSYYLTANLTGVSGSHGITLGIGGPPTALGGGVTLDLNGFALQGAPGSLSGVFVSSDLISWAGNFPTLTVRNGTVSGWGGSGVDARTPVGNGICKLSDLRVLNSGSDGIIILGGALVADCNVEGSRSNGISLLGGGVVSGCLIRDSGNDGILFVIPGVLVGPSPSLVRACLVQTSGLDGIVIPGGGALVMDCQVEGSVNNGISSGGGTVRGCVVRNSGQTGISSATPPGPDSISVSDSHIEGSGLHGILLLPGTASGCTVLNSVRSGIYVDRPGSLVIGNNVRGANTGANANDAGIYLNDSDNRVEGNHVTGSTGAGIVVNGADVNNVVIKNSVSGITGPNAISYLVPGNNDLGPVGTAANASSPWANIAH